MPTTAYIMISENIYDLLNEQLGQNTKVIYNLSPCLNGNANL